MGLFSGIMDKIFGYVTAAVSSKSIAPASTAAPATPTASTASASSEQAPEVSAAVESMPAAVSKSVDVAAVLDDLAKHNSEDLNWRKSIVDLMKLVGIDSSLNSRKELADELNYTGDMSDSASMNIWLHNAVIKKLAANGGAVPADLLD